MRLFVFNLCLIFSLIVGKFSLAESDRKTIGPEEHAFIAPFKSKAANIIKLIGMKNAELGFGISLSLNPRVQVYYNNYEVYYGVPSITLKDAHNKYTTTFLQQTYQLIEFTNDKIFDDLFGTNQGTLYNQLTTPQWTPEHAIEIAKHFLPLIFDRNDVILGPPYANYIHQFHQIPQHYTGFWKVGWSRVDQQGHLFMPSEDVWLDIAESRGVFSARIQFPSAYQEQLGPTLKSDDVLAAARKNALQTMMWPPVAQWFQNGMIESKPRSVTLGIVSPNHLLTSKGILLQHDHDARLAWIFWFAWNPSGNPKQAKPIIVWIDAHTGEYLGGDVGISAE